MRVFLGWILRSLLREICSITEIRHSRMFLAGIQGMLGLDPRLKRSGVTTWDDVLVDVFYRRFMLIPVETWWSYRS
jgi:hypothetical protein